MFRHLLFWRYIAPHRIGSWFKSNLGFGLTTFVLFACSGEEGAWTQSRHRQAAAVLVEKRLYQQAVDLYTRYLHSPATPASDVPRVLLQLGSLEQDHLRNPAAALSHFSILQRLFPEKEFNGELGRRVIECLEQMGRSSDAASVLKQQTELVQQGSGKDDTEGEPVVAEIDGRKISLGEIEDVVGHIPSAPLEKNQLIRQYVAQQLMAQAAKRKGLDRKEEIRIRLQGMENQILAQAAFLDYVKIPEPSALDLENFYKANLQRFKSGPDSLAPQDKVMEKVRMEWLQQKQSEAYHTYIEQLLQANQVKFYGGQP